ncbi:MAG: DNA mismatch repair endonuclease MutL [Caldiserica bacterium]|nr:MAG: DNA mismatch repair endonuclease MutL [Caldisericota bacterium]
MPIKILPEEVIRKIAAGEVIERPSSCVKELVENSIDANARRIDIFVENAGKSLIRVVDDGEGISKEELPLTVKHHATSKIERVEDLFKIRTFGFRGEALASIAQVSKLTITSRKRDENVGARVSVEGGKEVLFVEVGAPSGTEVIVRDLFYNTPVRRRFLKRDSTELRNIIKIVENISIPNYNVRFSFYSNGKKVFTFAERYNLKDRIVDVLGKDFMEDSVYFESENYLFKFYGFISKGKTKRKTSFIYVNGRFVSSPIVRSAIINACSKYIPNKEIGFVVFIEIDPSFVDVNIHPAKKEIRFLKEDQILRGIYRGIDGAFKKKDFVVSFDINKIKVEEGLKEQDFSYFVFPQKSKEDFKFLGKSIKIFGQVFKKYIIFSSEDELFLMDQHTASERLKYEELKRMFEEKRISQRVLIEEKIALRMSDYSIMEENKAVLKSVGIEWESFGPGIIKIKTVPASLPQGNIEKLIKEIVVILEERGKKSVVEAVFDDIIKLIACRSAVKEGDNLSYEEMEDLVKRVLISKSIYCPHGRPVLVKLTLKDLDRFFERR